MDSLVDFSACPTTVTFDGNTHEIHPLTIGDFAACQQWMRDQRIDTLLKATRRTPMESEVLGDALAKITGQGISILDMLMQADAESYLLYLSLKRGGSKLTYEAVVKDMPATKRAVMTKIVHLITGLSDPVPLGVPDSTTPGKESSTKANNGTTKSEYCATATA